MTKILDLRASSVDGNDERVSVNSCLFEAPYHCRMNSVLAPDLAVRMKELTTVVLEYATDMVTWEKTRTFAKDYPAYVFHSRAARIEGSVRKFCVLGSGGVSRSFPVSERRLGSVPPRRKGFCTHRFNHIWS